MTCMIPPFSLASSFSTKYNQQILVGTPGMMLELHKRNMVNFKHLKVLVFDEADVMLDKQGMGTQSIRLKKYELL
jgi:ATP-dependent RNA helicase DDX19/DBP5